MGKANDRKRLSAMCALIVQRVLRLAWAALVLTGLGDGLPLLTLQPADRPWETWLVLPVAWALAVWAARHFISQDPATVPYQDPVSGSTTTASRATVRARPERGRLVHTPRPVAARGAGVRPACAGVWRAVGTSAPLVLARRCTSAPLVLARRWY